MKVHGKVEFQVEELIPYFELEAERLKIIGDYRETLERFFTTLLSGDRPMTVDPEKDPILNDIKLLDEAWALFKDIIVEVETKRNQLKLEGKLPADW